jgi:hypothetical protein
MPELIDFRFFVLGLGFSLLAGNADIASDTEINKE